MPLRPRPSLSPTPRSTLTRKRHRAATDRSALHAILDEALICHLGVVLDGSPVVVPTAFARDGDTVYLHGSTGSGNLRAASAGGDVCVTVSILDGIVYARSLADHTMNYRSAVLHGRARPVVEPGAKWHALTVLSEHLAPGSWDHARRPDDKELAATAVLALELTEASVKIRAGGPGGAEDDPAADSTWAGVLPVHTTFGAPVPAQDVPARLPVPHHVAARSGVNARTAPR